MNPYVFFVGCPRSGTTLLGRIGDAHPELAVIHETRWIADWYEKRTGLSPQGHVTPAMPDLLVEHPRFSKLGIDRTDLHRLLLAPDGPLAYGDFIAALFDLYGERRHKRVVGDKTPRYVRSIPTLSALWPHAKFVHLIRDGRDVCLSVLDWRKGATNYSTWDEDPISTAALWWEWQVRLGREAEASLGADRYYELRYESLVSDPERECVSLCDFLGLRYDGAMLRFHEGRARRDPKLDAKKAWRPVTVGLRSWKEQMAPADVERFEAAGGPLLAELGYERAAESTSGEAFARAGRLRKAFAQDARARHRRLPSSWEAMAS